PPWQLLNGSVTVNSSTSSTPPECSQIIIGTGVYERNRFIVINSTHTRSAASYIYYVDGINAGLLAKIADGVHSKMHRYSDDVDIVAVRNGSSGSAVRYVVAGGLVAPLYIKLAGFAFIG